MPRKRYIPPALDGEPLVFTGLFDEEIDMLEMEAEDIKTEIGKMHLEALCELGLETRK